MVMLTGLDFVGGTRKVGPREQFSVDIRYNDGFQTSGS